MLRKGQMRPVEARSVKKDDILIRDGTIVRILVAEWPYAVIRVFRNGQFGMRQVMKLSGTYSAPSEHFLREVGVYESKLLDSEGDAECVIGLEELVDEPLRLDHALSTSDYPGNDDEDAAGAEFVLLDLQ